MCVACGGSYDFEEAKKIGYLAPELSKLEFNKRMEIFVNRSQHPETWPEVKWDNHGLIWSDGKVLINVYESRRRAELAEKYQSGEIESHWPD